MPIAHRNRSAVIVSLFVFWITVNGCAHLEVVRLSAVPGDKDLASDGTIFLQLTQPAWEVKLNNGNILVDETIQVRPVNVADPLHIYRVMLFQGFLTFDRLKIYEPHTSGSAYAGKANNSNAHKEDTLVVYPEVISKNVEFPDEEEILTRFRKSGGRVFILIRPE